MDGGLVRGDGPGLKLSRSRWSGWMTCI